MPLTRCAGGAAVLCCIAFSANAAAAGSSRVAPGLKPWVAYLQQLRLQADHTPAVRSAQAAVKANEASVDAQTGDRDLSLKLGFVDYPNGAGTGENGSFTDLERRGEARLSWGVLDFFGRRPGRIDSASMDVDMAQAGVDVARRQAMQTIVERSVLAWAAGQQRHALDNAKNDLAQARETLGKLRHHELTRKLSEAATQAGSQVMELQTRVAQAAGRLPVTNGKLPAPPAAYGALPTVAPSLDTALQLAKNSPRAAMLKAKSGAFTAQERAHWAENFHVDVYGGYVRQVVRGEGGAQSGPEVGVAVSVPLGGGGSGKRANAHWQARQQALAAQDAVQQEQRLLEQTLQQWSQASTALKGQATLIRHMATRLERMHERAAASASPRAPERWELQLASARFWVAVADMWKTRAQWVDAALTWSLYDGGKYLQSHARPGGQATGHGLCAPLAACPQI